MGGPISTIRCKINRDQTFHIVLDTKLSLYEFRSIIQIFNPAASLLKFGFFLFFSENIEKLQKNRNRLISHWE